MCTFPIKRLSGYNVEKMTLFCHIFQGAVIIVSSIEIDTRQWVGLIIAQNAWRYELFINSEGAKLNAKAL